MLLPFERFWAWPFQCFGDNEVVNTLAGIFKQNWRFIGWCYIFRGDWFRLSCVPLSICWLGFKSVNVGHRELLGFVWEWPITHNELWFFKQISRSWRQLGLGQFWIVSKVEAVSSTDFLKGIGVQLNKLRVSELSQQKLKHSLVSTRWYEALP